MSGTPANPAVTAVKATMAIARGLTEGTLRVEDMHARAVARCEELMGTVIGPASPVWALQQKVARGVLAVDGIPADELAEWLAVTRAKQGVTGPGPPPVSWVERALAEDEAGGE